MSEVTACEREFDFSLILGGIEEITPELADEFFKAGCDDATLSFQSGAAHLEFSRSSPSMKEAVLSAISDVCKVGKGVFVRQIDDCSLVTQSEIARKINRSRQLVSQFVNTNNGIGHFPAPLFVGNKPYWAWCEVSYWLFQNNVIRGEILEEAQVMYAINNALDRICQQRMNRTLVEEIEASLQASCG